MSSVGSPSPTQSEIQDGDTDSDIDFSGEEEQEESEAEESALESEPPSIPPTPPGTPPPEQVKRDSAVECVDRLFRRAKLHLLTPNRWTRVFLNAATQYEARLDRKREQLHMAVSQDDTQLLVHLKSQTSEELFNWWSYDLNLVVRASTRLRPEVTKHLPDLYGQIYPGRRKVAAIRAALDEEFEEGSSRLISEMQRGQLLLKDLRTCLEKQIEINVDGPGGLEDILNHKASGPWQSSDIPAVGINYAVPHAVFAGWRAIHFVAANCHATKTAIPALELLFKAKADATLVDGGGSSALHTAAMRGHLDVITMLLDHGCPLDAEDLGGCSAMNIAARCRHYRIIRTMAEWMLPENAHDVLFHTPAERLASQYSLANGHVLHISVSRGNFEKVKELLELEPPDTANVNYADPNGRRAVHLAAGFISNEWIACDMLKILVGKKADVNARDAASETPLHVAAKLGRAHVVKTLLLLHAHPNIPDLGKRTPLMLAALGPDEDRVPPAYNGVPVNKPLSWTTIQDVLDWNGRGEPPLRSGPEPRKVRGPAANHARELFGARKSKALTQAAMARKKSRDYGGEDDEEDGGGEEDEEDSSEEEGGDEKDAYFTVNDIILARANALCQLGFDDQNIVEADGRVNRGDRMQLFQHLFQPSRTHVPKFPGDKAPLVPNDVRCRFVWKHLTGPLLQMEQQGILPPRASQLLAYVLRVVLGKKGPAFGVLVSYGYDARIVPLWTQIEEALKKPTLDQRLEIISKMGFVGGKPKLQKWVGCKWDPESFPRHPIHAPWGAFAYLDKDDEDYPPLVLLQKHHKYNVRPLQNDQAFKDNCFAVFEKVPEGSMPTGAPPLPSRNDQLMLASRMYLNETAGVRRQVEPRARLVGEMLICPMLSEILSELETKGVVTENQERHDILEYLGVSMFQPTDCYVYVDQPRRPFKDLWEDVHERAIKVLCREKDPLILSIGPQEDAGRVHHKSLATMLKGTAKMVAMVKHEDHASEAMKKHKEKVAQEMAVKSNLVVYETAMPHESVDLLIKQAPPGDYGQFALLNDDDKRWLLRGESVRAFIELKRCTCIKTCEDFSELVCSIAVGGLQDFHGRFWRAAFGLFLWGRAKLLQTVFALEISRRLPKKRSYELKGPFLRPRADVLGISELAVQAKKRLALMASEPPWVVQPKAVFGENAREQRPPLDFNAGKPDGGVKMPTGVGLFNGFTDLLHAEVLCDNAKAMVKAYKALTGKPMGTKNLSRRNTFKDKCNVINNERGPAVITSILGVEGRGKFGVLRVVNSLREDQQKVIPLCASVKLVCAIGWTPIGYGPALEQLVEIEIMLKATKQARWLAKYMDIKPEEMPRSRNEDDDWSPVTRKSVK